MLRNPSVVITRRELIRSMGAAALSLPLAGLTGHPENRQETITRIQPMATKKRFHQVDVFTHIPLKGNALAVVHDASGLEDEAMAAFARWTNLSETTFLLPPSDPRGDYRVRIFTVDGELPFAGHPTLGSCFAWLAGGGKPKSSEYIIQECGVGLVKIRRSGNRLAFAAPPLRRTGPLDDVTLSEIRACLKLPPDAIRAHQWVDNGPGWAGVMLNSAKAVLDLNPDFAKLTVPFGVIGAHDKGNEADFEVRTFYPSLGNHEDPVTGSLNASMAQWMIGEGLAPDHYVVAQGARMKRNGRIYIDRIGDDIWVGGDVVTCIEGHVNL